jgi:hypothetical protein
MILKAQGEVKRKNEKIFRFLVRIFRMLKDIVPEGQYICHPENVEEAKTKYHSTRILPLVNYKINFQLSSAAPLCSGGKPSTSGDAPSDRKENGWRRGLG